MHENIKAESFRQLLGNSQILDFTQEMLTQSYVECAPGHEYAMRRLMERAFNTLVDSRQDADCFEAAVASLVSEIFTKQEPGFWFNRVYKYYKREIKPYRRFKNLSPLLAGKRILDLGCGDGLTSLALQQSGYQVSRYALYTIP